MTTRAPKRDTLYQRLREVLGNDQAATLMELLPEHRDRLATKSDMKRIDQRFEHVDSRMDQLDRRMEKFEDRLWDLQEALRAQTRTYIAASVGSTLSVGALAFAAAALI